MKGFVSPPWFLLLLFAVFFYGSCKEKSNDKVRVGFVEAFEDETIGEARKGFFDALADKGFSEDQGTLEIVYRNAQGDQGILSQVVSYMSSQKLDLIGTSTTLATLGVIQRVHDVPVFMTVTATPEILGITDRDGHAPANLFGAAENLDYIDTSFTIIKQVAKPRHESKVRIGMIYNQAEPQSVDAYNRLNRLAQAEEMTLVALPLNSSAEAQLVVKALLNKGIDVFFANPDNTVFAAFETILKNCNEAQVPVFTSEEGLVKRGAVAAYGADIYAWGYESGADAANYLQTKSTERLGVHLVQKRKRVYNKQAAEKFGYQFPSDYEGL
ncbi:ABC transporter substrate-binding protein [Olivibacter sitiensis]|uniref:ABC transporter substrate-binding protein n=1 Tax=Olivibacter sitiensis TaxID=376470 RepID=UPI0003F50628|nr:ABC transporter substrate-binding protein [Olivibacter sitiensis]